MTSLGGEMQFYQPDVSPCEECNDRDDCPWGHDLRNCLESAREEKIQADFDAWRERDGAA